MESHQNQGNSEGNRYPRGAAPDRRFHLPVRHQHRLGGGCAGRGGIRQTLPHVIHAEESMFSCSQDTQDMMAKVIREKQLNRVVVSACTPKTHEPLFQETVINAGINKYLFEMANIRNQCSWVHGQTKEAATEKPRT
jgi:hypothetical protein